MKRFSFLLFFALLSSQVSAAVATLPVGFMSFDVPGNSDALMAVPFTQQAIYTGAVISTAVIDATTGTLTVAVSDTWEADEFVYNPGNNQNQQFFVRVIDSQGAQQGMWYYITDNDTDTLTLDTANQNAAFTLASGDMFQIAPLWTLATLFDEGGELTPSTDLAAPTSGDVVSFMATADSDFINTEAAGEVNAQFSHQYFYYDNSVNGGTSGFYDVNDTGAGVQDDLAIAPDTFMVISNNDGTVDTHVFYGFVPSADMATIIQRDDDDTDGALELDNHVANPFPVALTLEQTNLQNSSVFRQATSGTFTSPDGDRVLVFDEGSTRQNRSADRVYFYYQGDGTWSAGWYNLDNKYAGSVSQVADPETNPDMIPAGSGFIVRTRDTSVSASGINVADLPYNLD